MLQFITLATAVELSSGLARLYSALRGVLTILFQGFDRDSNAWLPVPVAAAVGA